MTEGWDDIFRGGNGGRSSGGSEFEYREVRIEERSKEGMMRAPGQGESRGRKRGSSKRRAYMKRGCIFLAEPEWMDLWLRMFGIRDGGYQVA